MGKLRRILGFLSFLAIVFFGTNSFADNTEPCPRGSYFDASVFETKTCPGNGYYCPGVGDYDVDGTTNACLEKCSSDLGAFFDKSSVGASNSNADCWGVVYLNKNGGRGTIYNEDTTDDAIATCFQDDMTGAGCILGTNITRSGYKFNGWGTSEDCTSGITVYTDTSKASPTLYACWVPVWSVSLYNSGGTSTYGSDYIYAIQNTGWYSDASGTQKLSEIPIPTKENCTFNGYFFEDMEMVTSAGKLNPGSTSVIDQNIEIVAEWTCKITCNAGTYYDASTQSCATCPAGYYCTGGPFDKTNVDQGITECPGDFTDGGSGLSSEDQCVFTLKPGTMIEGCDYFTVSVYETCGTKNNYFCPGYSVTVGDVDPANNVTWCNDYDDRYECPENSTTNFSYCTCNTGYFGWSGGVSGDKLDRLTSPTHTCMVESYYCEQGTYLPAGQTTCATCPAGSYCIGDTYGYDASNDSGIEACPEGHTSSGGAGSEDECYPETYFVPFFCDSSKTTTIETQDVVYGGNIFGQPASVAQAKCDKPGYHVINYVCNNFEVMPGSTATYVSPFQEECVAKWGENNYFITIDYNTPVGCTDDELCGSFEGKIAPALTAGDAQYKATKDISVQYNGTLAAIPIEYQQRKGYELVYYVPYPEDVTIFLDPNNGSGATSMLWMVEDGDTGEYVSTTKWTYDGENNTSIKYYPMWRAKTIKCDNGGYLPAGSEECAICPAGSYCDGGTFEYSDTTDQGKYPCPAFPYNNSGEGNGSQENCYAYCTDLADYYSGGIVYYWKSNRVEEECAKEIYDVTFKCNGTTVSTSSVEYGGYITMPPADACNITGYYVSEWIETGYVVSGAPGAIAQWTWTDEDIPSIVINANLVPYTLTINYDAGNGNGSAPVAPTTCTYADKDAACFAPASTFTPPVGHVFSHWVVTEGGYLGTTFNPGADMAYMAHNGSLSITLQAVYEISDEAISCREGSYLPKGGLTTSDCKVCDSGSYCTGGAWRYSDTTDQGITECPYIFTDGAEGYAAAKECTANAIEGKYIVYDESNTDAPFRTVDAMTAGNTSSYYPTGTLTYEQASSDIKSSSSSIVTWFKEDCPANSKNTAYAPYCTCNADYVSSSTDAERKSLNAVIKGETCKIETITCVEGTYYNGTSKTCTACPEGYYCDETVTVNKNSTTNAGLKSCITNAFTDGTVDNVTSDKGSTSKTDCQIRIPAGKQLASITGQIYDLESGWYSGSDSIINYSDELPAVDDYATSCANDMGKFYNKSNPGATSHLECYGLLTLTKNDATGLLYNADGTVVNGDETNTDSVDYKCYVSESDPYNNCVLPSTGTLSNPGWIINGWGTDSSCTVGASTINTSGMTPQSAEVFACMKQNIVKAQCDPGYFLPANSDSVDDCEQCRNSGYCVGGEYELNSTEDQGIEACPEPYVVSEPGAEDIGKCYTTQTEACTDPCGGERYCKNCPNDSFLSCAYDTTATVEVRYFYSGETKVAGDETCPVLYNTYTKCSSGMYLTNSAKDCSAKCSALTGSCKNATGGTETCWSSSIDANMSAGANACYGAGCTPTCNLFNDYVLGTDYKLTGEYVNHCPEHATCIEATLPSNGYRWYPNTICTPTTFCSFTYTCDAGYVASTTGNIEYGYSRKLHDNPMTAITIASCDPGVFEVTLDANGGTGGTTTMYQKYTVGWYSDESASNALGTITIPTKDRYTFTGYYINDIEVVDMDGIVNPGASNLFTSDGVITAQWAAKSITCGAGYYYDYANMVCAECQSPYYCPGGTFDMTVDSGTGSDLGKKDCKIDAFPYYAGNIDASAIGSYRGAKAKTGCYVMLPAGKEIVSVDGRIADLRSGYYFGGGQVQYTGDIPDFTEYATKCSDDLGMGFYEHSNVGAESYTECYGTITLNKSGATGLLYDQSNNVINGDSETAQSVEYKCYATGDDVSFCSLPKTTSLSREGWSIGDWDTVYDCTGTGQTQINLNNMTSGTDMYVCMSRSRITCDAGMYLPMGATTCRECEMGKYCPGGTFTYSESADNGLNQCPSIFTYGDTGTKSESECRTMAIEAQYIKYANGVFQIAQDDSDNEYCTGGMLTYGQAMTDVAKGENTWFKYQCPSNSSNTDGAPYCLCNQNYTTSSDDATLIALNAAINGNMCLRNTCEAGTYMKNNECLVCPAGNVCSTDVPGNAPKTCSELTGGLYTLSAPGSSSIDACYTECEEYAITNGTAVPVEDTVFYPFECEFTGRSQTGNPCDIVNSTCIETSCNHNFELINGICTPCARENAISYKQGGNCVIESCVSGFHPNGQVCEANVIECSAPNAIASTQKWDSNKNAFGECIITECADGYHLGSNACQANEQVCELEHGIGVREWNHNTNKWGECVATECDPGYTNDSSLTNEGWKQCGRCNNMYSANGELAVSSYVKGCEIASCMYQGELYNLENNECRLICDTYSDETGSRKWNASRKKCEHTCAPGYVTW